MTTYKFNGLLLLLEASRYAPADPNARAAFIGHRIGELFEQLFKEDPDLGQHIITVLTTALRK